MLGQMSTRKTCNRPSMMKHVKPTEVNTRIEKRKQVREITITQYNCKSKTEEGKRQRKWMRWTSK